MPNLNILRKQTFVYILFRSPLTQTLHGVSFKKWTRGPGGSFIKLTYLRVRQLLYLQVHELILLPYSRVHELVYSRVRQLYETASRCQNVFVKNSGIWKNGPEYHCSGHWLFFRKFIPINLGKQLYVYILGHLSHRQPMGCVSKTGPEDQMSEKILKNSWIWSSGPEDHWSFFGEFIPNNLCKQPFVYILRHRHTDTRSGVSQKTDQRTRNLEIKFKTRRKCPYEYQRH